MLPWLVAAPAPAVAPAATAAPTGDRPELSEAEARPRYRSGLVIGLSLGGGVGRGDGYPNDTNDIGRTYHQASPWMAGTGASLLVMGALADVLDVGFWFSSATFHDSTQHATQTGLGLRVEVFPFVHVAPRIAGLGAIAQFGLGLGRLSTPGLPEASGVQSIVGTGVFYEWAFGHVLGGHFAAGPSVEYDAMFSRPYDQNGLLATARVVFYGGP